MNIYVVNKYSHTPQPNDIYIGRGSALGNPFPITPLEDRDCVCDKYEAHLKVLNAPMVKQLNKIVHTCNQYGFVNLVCFCAPKRCHGDSIKQLILNKLQETTSKE